MPEHDLSLLVTLNVGMTLSAILAITIGTWAIMRQMSQNTREITEHTREIATMQREVAFMIRRQYADIDQDLQEIKALLEGR